MCTGWNGTPASGLSCRTPALRCLAESAGVGQMLFGTDYPYVVGDPERALRAVEAAGFSPADLDAIYHRNVTAELGSDLP